jgi:MFS family permease
MRIKTVSPKHALIPLGIGIGLSLFGDSTLYTVLPDPIYAAQAGVSMAMVGVLLGANRFTRLFFNSLAGTLFDRLPRRRLMIAAMVVGMLSTTFYAAGSGPVLMLVGRVLWGIAWSGIWIGSNAIALDIAEGSNRGLITGKLQMWFSLGIAITTFAGGLFTDLFTYRGGLWVSAGLGFLGILTWLFFLPETQRNFSPPTLDTDPPVPTKNHFPWKSVLIAAAPMFAVRFTISGVLNSTTILWLSQYVNGGISFGNILIPIATLTGGFAATRVLVGTASAPFIGALSDLIKQRWTVLALLLLAGTLGIGLMSLPWLGAGLIGALLAALTYSGVPTISSALVGDHILPKLHARGLGVIYTVGDLGATLGPVIGLGLVPILGIQRVYLICAGLYCISAILSVLMALQRPKSHQM